MVVKKKAAKKRATTGRPTVYKAVFAEQAEKLCLLGAIDAELADFFEIDVRTIHRWKKKHPTFCHSIRRGKTIADAAVAAKLFERAVGYDYQEFTEVAVDGKKVSITCHDKHMAPDVKACIFWLKNRRKEDWRDVFAHTDAEGNAFALHIHKECQPHTGKGTGN